MTIEIAREVSHNLFSDPVWPLFSQRKDLRSVQLSVCAFKWTSKEWDTNALLDSSENDIGDKIVEVSRDLKCTIQAFFMDLTLQPKSATVLHRGLWKALYGSKFPEALTRGAEVRIDCQDGVRFAALATVAPGAARFLVSVARKFDIVVPILMPVPLQLDESTPLELARLASPPDGCYRYAQFDWPRFVSHISSRGGLVVRQVVDLAHNKVSANFFFGSSIDLASCSLSSVG